MTTVTKIFVANAYFNSGSDPNLRYLINPQIGVTCQGFPGEGAVDPYNNPVYGGGGGVVSGSVPWTQSTIFYCALPHYAGGAGGAGTGGRTWENAGSGGGSVALVSGGAVLMEAGGGGGAGGGSFVVDSSGLVLGGSTGGQGGGGGINPGNGFPGGQGDGALGGFNVPAQGGLAGGGTPINGGYGDPVGSNSSGGVGGAGAPSQGSPQNGAGGGGGGGWAGGGGGGGGAGLFETAVNEGNSGAGGGGGQSYAASSVINPVFTDYASGAGSIELTYTYADAPFAPNIVSPRAGSFLDGQNDPVVFTFAPSPGTDSGSMNAYALKIFFTAGAYYWNAATGAFQSALVYNPCSPSTRSITIPAGILVTGYTYTWSISTQESHFNLTSPFSFPAQFTSATPPGLTITSPAEGQVEGLEPYITWTNSFQTGYVQVGYEIFIYETATTLEPSFAPGVTPAVWVYATVFETSAATQQLVTSPLTNGQNYTVYMRILETGGTPSNWESVDFSVNLFPPAAPNLTLSTIADEISGQPGVVLTLSQNDNQLNASDSTFLQGPFTWTFTGCTGAQAPSWFQYVADLKEMRLHSTAATMSGQTNEKVPCAAYAGGTMTVLGLVQSETASCQFSIGAVFYNSSGTPNGLATIGYSTTATGGTQLHGTINIPSNAAFVDLAFTAAGATVGAYYSLSEMGMWFDYDPGASGWSAGGYFGEALTTFNVQRSTDYYLNNSHATWTDVRPGSLVGQAPSNAFAIDWEVPLNVPVYYRAQVMAPLFGNIVTGPFQSPPYQMVEVYSNNWWISDPTDPSANPFQPTSWGYGSMALSRVTSQSGSTASGVGVSIEINQIELQGTFNPFGRDNYTVVHGDLLNEEFDLTLYFDNSALWENFASLRARQRTLCLRSDMEGAVYYVALGPNRPRDIYSTTDRLSESGPLSQMVIHCYPQDAPPFD